MLHQYNKNARKRIARSVHWTESQSQPVPGRRQRPTAYQQHKLVRAQADIEHGQIGGVKHLAGPAFGGSLDLLDGDEEFQAYNPGRKVWSGSDMILGRLALPDSDESNETNWFIVQAWSATRIRGTTNSIITPGSVGTITLTQRIDGTFEPATASVYLPTQFVEVGASRVIWAELVYQTSTGTSRWEAYSADCDGGGA